MYWSDEVGGYASCPACGARLESEQHAYVMVTRRGGVMDYHISANTAGHFCGICPVVVLDRNEVEKFATLPLVNRDLRLNRKFAPKHQLG